MNDEEIAKTVFEKLNTGMQWDYISQSHRDRYINIVSAAISAYKEQSEENVREIKAALIEIMGRYRLPTPTKLIVDLWDYINTL